MLLDITSWWQSIPFFEQAFWAIAIVFSLLFLIQTIMSFAAGDADVAEGDADSYVGEDEGIGYQFFTIKNLIAFFTLFGWMGIAGIKGGWSQGLTIVMAVLAGSAMVGLMALVMRGASKLKHSGTMQMKNALNQTGETYLRIPGRRGGRGKVHVRVQGTLHELPAITDDVADIPTGSIIRVKEIVNDSMLLVTAQL
jgi:hypothetical protein